MDIIHTIILYIIDFFNGQTIYYTIYCSPLVWIFCVGFLFFCKISVVCSIVIQMKYMGNVITLDIVCLLLCNDQSTR